MPLREDILDRLAALLGRPVTFLGKPYRLAELLRGPARIVLAPTGPARSVVQDAYGHPAAVGHEFVELPVFDSAGGLNEDIRLVCLADVPEPGEVRVP